MALPDYAAGTVVATPDYAFPTPAAYPMTPAARPALDVQVGGGHYKDLKIQPIEYIFANSIPFAEGCAIKYLTRWRSKGGLQDLEKARHFIDLLIDHERAKGQGA